MTKLRSISNKYATLLRKLSQSKHRKKEGLFLAEGHRSIKQIIQNGKVKTDALFFDESTVYWQNENWKKLTRDHEIDGYLIKRNDFSGFTLTDNPQGILALCHIPDEFPLRRFGEMDGVIIACDAIQDPGNLGTIVRTGVWFGAAALLCGKGTVDLYNPKVVRSTAGSTGVLPRHSAPLEEILPVLEKQGWEIFLLDAADGAKALHKIKPPEKSIIVVGNEANGINSALYSNGRSPVIIPSFTTSSDAESLNAAISVGIAMHHFRMYQM